MQNGRDLNRSCPVSRLRKMRECSSTMHPGRRRNDFRKRQRSHRKHCRRQTTGRPHQRQRFPRLRRRKTRPGTAYRAGIRSKRIGKKSWKNLRIWIGSRKRSREKSRKKVMWRRSEDRMLPNIQAALPENPENGNRSRDRERCLWYQSKKNFRKS